MSLCTVNDALRCFKVFQWYGLSSFPKIVCLHLFLYYLFKVFDVDRSPTNHFAHPFYLQRLDRPGIQHISKLTRPSRISAMLRDCEMTVAHFHLIGRATAASERLRTWTGTMKPGTPLKSEEDVSYSFPNQIRRRPSHQDSTSPGRNWNRQQLISFGPTE